MADEEEKRVRRRLLEHLQERIGARRLELVHRVDNDDTPRRQSSRQPEELAQLANLMDADAPREVAGLLVHQPLEMAHVRVSPGVHQPDDGVLVVGLQSRQLEWRARRLGEDAPSSCVRKTCLAHALGTGQQPGMVQLACRPGAGELVDGAILADDHRSRSASSWSNRAVTAWGDPEASTSLTRS